MDLVASLTVFILLWWAILATIFSFKLHKENEDYARRLGKRRDAQKISKPKYVNEISNSFLPAKLNSLKFYLTRLSADRIWRLIPLK